MRWIVLLESLYIVQIRSVVSVWAPMDFIYLSCLVEEKIKCKFWMLFWKRIQIKELFQKPHKNFCFGFPFLPLVDILQCPLSIPHAEKSAKIYVHIIGGFRNNLGIIGGLRNHFIAKGGNLVAWTSSLNRVTVRYLNYWVFSLKEEKFKLKFVHKTSKKYKNHRRPQKKYRTDVKDLQKIFISWHSARQKGRSPGAWRVELCGPRVSWRGWKCRGSWTALWSRSPSPWSTC